MRYYLRHHEEGKGAWIIEFNDETKKWETFIGDNGDLDAFECEEIEVEDGEKVYQETEGKIVRYKKTPPKNQ